MASLTSSSESGLPKSGWLCKLSSVRSSQLLRGLKLQRVNGTGMESMERVEGLGCWAWGARAAFVSVGAVLNVPPWVPAVPCRYEWLPYRTW